MGAPSVIFLIFLLIKTCYLNGISHRNNACRKLSSYIIADYSPHCYYNEDVLSDIESIVKRHNYKFKSYKVNTDDGYILSLFRIGSPKTGITRNPILIQHGISTSSVIWVYTGNRSLAFNLADLGYDVWLGNFRGTTYSYKHTNLTPSNAKYWNFTLDALAKYDLPAELNFVAKVTGKARKIIYLAHSMGTTVGLMYASETNENLVEKYVMLAPVAYMHGLRFIDAVMPIVRSIFKILESSNVKGLLFREDLTKKVLLRACQLQPQICMVILQALSGRSQQFPPEDLLLYFSYWPSGASVKQFEQYIQIAASKKFQKFDYGLEINQAAYGSKEPPQYNLSKITQPVYLFYGKKDTLNNENLVTKLYTELRSAEKKMFPVAKNDKFAFSHVDFFHSSYLRDYLYPPLFNVL